MTEEEAKTKWCPFARAQTADTDAAPAVNRTLRGGIDLGCHCIGSACMAWRWDDDLLPKPNSLSQGHCGLAGKP